MSGRQKETEVNDIGQGTVLSGRYITVEEYAAATGLSLATARRRAQGISKIPFSGQVAEAVKVGRQWLVRISNS